jgi:hypothetical protein
MMNAAHIHNTLSSCCATLQQMLRRNMCLSITPQHTAIRTTTCTAPPTAICACTSNCLHLMLPQRECSLCLHAFAGNTTAAALVPQVLCHPAVPAATCPLRGRLTNKAVQLFHNETLSWNAPAPAQRDQQSSAFLSVCLSCHQVAHGNT